MIANEIVLEALAEYLKECREISLSPKGFSMGYKMAQADTMTIRAVSEQNPRFGDIVVCRYPNVWVAHRVIWLFPERSRWYCITKGDRLKFVDLPFVEKKDCVGVVVAMKWGATVKNFNTISMRASSLVKGLFGLVIGLLWLGWKYLHGQKQ